MAITALATPYDIDDMFGAEQRRQLQTSYPLHALLLDGRRADAGSFETHLQKMGRKAQTHLEQAEPYYRLTPLLLAAVSGQEGALRTLVQRKVNLLAVSKDGYTVAHHLAIGRKTALLQWLLAQDKSRTLAAAKTVDGKTAADLSAMLERRSAADAQAVFNIWDEQTNMVTYGATAARFRELTGAYYSDEIITSPQMLAWNWVHGDMSQRLRSNALGRERLALYGEAYAAYKAKPPLLYLRYNAAIGGHEVVADEEIPPRRVVKVYTGIEETSSSYTLYLMDKVNGAAVRNLAAMINDSFPNVAFLDASTEQSNGVTTLVMSCRKISRGEVLCVDYGGYHPVKRGRHVELNEARLLQAFAAPDSLGKYCQLIRFNEAQAPSLQRRLFVEDFLKGPLLYLFETPTSLLTLLALNRLQVDDCLACCAPSSFLSALPNIEDLRLFLNNYRRGLAAAQRCGLHDSFNDLLLALSRLHHYASLSFVVAFLADKLEAAQSDEARWRSLHGDVQRLAATLDAMHDAYDAFVHSSPCRERALTLRQTMQQVSDPPLKIMFLQMTPQKLQALYPDHHDAYMQMLSQPRQPAGRPPSGVKKGVND